MLGTQVGAYRILEQIGEGGMGSVWMAEHSMLGRRAAIKVLHREFSTRTEIVQRFFNEARAATAISDPGIVQIFDFGHHTDGSAYIVMELLAGETLDHRLRRLGRLALNDALRIMRQVASSLGAAHARGIVHRDLKPENIYLVPDPEVHSGERAKILDFGIAKLTGDPSMKTSTSLVMGTPMYMSPEQCRGSGQVDQRSDVYALGCVLFTLLAGSPPFNSDGAGELIAMHLREPPPPLSSRIPNVSPDLDRLLLACMAKDPGQRFQSATDLAQALGALLGVNSNVGWTHKTGPQLPNAYPGTNPTPSPSSQPTTLAGASGVHGATQPPPARSRALLFGGVAALAVAATVTVLAVTHSDPAPVVATAPPPTPIPPPVPVPVPVIAPLPPPTPAPMPADPDAAIAAHMKLVLGSFTHWATSHKGDLCPDLATIVGPPADPWGRPVVLTCIDQPADQIVGATSAGPDGAMGTADDISSWQLGRDVTALVRGKRWVASPAAIAAAARKPRPAPGPVVVAGKRPPTTSSSAIVDPFAPGKPAAPKPTVILDDNGIPVQR